jgi:hypothetical protein
VKCSVYNPRRFVEAMSISSNRLGQSGHVQMLLGGVI